MLFPVLDGTLHLGAIRSLATTIMVVSTASGPGITGLLIDAGVDFPTQSLFWGLWCALITLLCWAISRKLRHEV